MNYKLDGIPTAMRLSLDDPDLPVRYACPCGWTIGVSQNATEVEALEMRAALRFHYTHCPLAKADGKP